MDNFKPANPYENPVTPQIPTTNGLKPPAPPAPATPAQSDSNGKIAAIVSSIIIFVAAFIAGIFFTIVMLSNSFSGTPLEFVQKPVLSMAGVPEDAQKEWLAFQRSFKLIDRYFFQKDKINHKEMIYHAAEAAVESLGDRFTLFTRPEVAKANSDFLAGRYVGIGITPEIRDGEYMVKRLIKDSPADKSGIKSGDFLTAINGEAVPAKLSNESAVTISEKLRGEVNSKLKVSFRRPTDNNKVTEYELTRSELTRPSVYVETLQDNYIYIEMKQVFGNNTVKEFDEAIEPFLKNNPSGFILDLRSNGGGSVTAAKEMLGRFLDGGVAYYEDSPANDVNMHPVDVVTSKDIKIYDKPLVVLVNGGSASASEITVAALRDRKRATVIGEKTYGKGVAQYVIPLEDKSALRVTFEQWFSPNKSSINGAGIKPDIEVVPTETQLKLNQDPQLDRALQFLATNK